MADAERQRAGRGAGRVLRIVQAAQRADAADPRDLAARAAGGAQDGFALDIDAVGAADSSPRRAPRACPHRSMRSAVLRHQPSSTPTIAVPLRLHAGDQTLLHRGVMLQRAVAVDMVLADIEQDADGRIERGREIDLVGRHLDDMDAAHARRLQRQDRGADIAAHLGVVAGDLHQMRDQRGGGRFAVGAGDGDERRIRRMTAALAAEQLDVADHLDAGLRAPSARSSAAPDG